MERIESNPDSEMMREVARMNAERKGGRSEESENEETLPPGAEPLAAAPNAPEETPEETSEGEAPAPVEEPADEPVRINGQEFKNAKEAFEYAERIAREKELTDAHAQGIREALEAQRLSNPAPAPQGPTKEELELEFYSDPVGAMAKVQARARDEAMSEIRAEQSRERAWNEFLTENPDIRRKDAERVLQENWQTIGTMTDLDRAKKLLAQKVRSEYAEISEMMKPRTQLADKKQTLSPAGGATRGVTPTKKEEKVLSFAEQMRKLKGN